VGGGVALPESGGSGRGEEEVVGGEEDGGVER
jgi:hypothetical protein